jgi:hypothetical protein
VTALRAIALVLALVLAASCSDDGPEAARVTTSSVPAASNQAETRVGPFEVLAGAATSRGELAPDLPIAPGSVLLGPVFPDASHPDGFVALLLVTSNPIAVYNHYMDEAASLGMRAGMGGGCIYGFGSITCARRVVDPADGEALSVLVERRPVAGGFVSHAALRYEPPGTVDPEDAPPDVPTPPTSTPPVLRLPTHVPAAADDAWSRLLSPGGPALSLADGTALAGPPGPCPCGTRGWSAVMKVDGSPDEAIEAYARQLGVERPNIRRGPGDVRVADLGLVPGGITQLRTASDARGTWLMFAVSLG